MAEAFLSLGAKAAIAVDKESPIDDKMATYSGSIFYEELLQGKTIQQSFDGFIERMNHQYFHECISCCCHHEHKEGCPWMAWKENRLKERIQIEGQRKSFGKNDEELIKEEIATEVIIGYRGSQHALSFLRLLEP